MSIPSDENARVTSGHKGGNQRGTGQRVRKRAAGDREGLPPDSSHSCAKADQHAASQTDENVALAKSMYLGVMKHPFMGIDDKLATLVRGGISPRDAFVLTAMARGATQKELGAATGLASVQHILDKFRDQLECLRMEVQMDGLMGDAPKVLKAQAEVAQDKKHDQFAAAGRNYLGAMFPNRGQSSTQLNIAGRDIVTGGGQVMNDERKLAIAAVHSKPLAEIEKELAELEAGFERPSPPNGGA